MNYDRHETREPVQSAKKAAAGSAKAMDDLLRLLIAVAAVVPDRTTIRQLVFLVASFRSVAMGQDVIKADIFRELEGIIGRSAEKSSMLWFEPIPSYPDGIGWLTQSRNPRDYRERLIGASPQGLGVMNLLTDIMADLEERSEEGAPER